MYPNQEQTPAPRWRRPSVNSVTLIGFLVTDPELRSTQQSLAVARLRLATHWQERTDFHTLIAFGREAELAAEHLYEGRLAYAEGREWTAEDGSRRRVTKVVAHRVQAVGARWLVGRYGAAGPGADRLSCQRCQGGPAVSGGGPLLGLRRLGLAAGGVGGPDHRPRRAQARAPAERGLGVGRRSHGAGRGHPGTGRHARPGPSAQREASCGRPGAMAREAKR
jgi:single-strand DNA-binding protein